MTVQEFINEYRNIHDIKKYIINDYVSFFRKKAEAEMIIDISTHKTVNGKKVFYVDSSLRYQLFIERLIANYTNIEIGEDHANDFDALNKEGLIDLIVAAIPKREYDEFSRLLNLCLDDLRENERSFVSYIDTKIDSISLLLNSLIQDEDIQQAIIEKIQQ